MRKIIFKHIFRVLPAILVAPLIVSFIFCVGIYFVNAGALIESPGAAALSVVIPGYTCALLVLLFINQKRQATFKLWQVSSIGFIAGLISAMAIQIPQLISSSGFFLHNTLTLSILFSPLGAIHGLAQGLLLRAGGKPT